MKESTTDLHFSYYFTTVISLPNLHEKMTLGVDNFLGQVPDSPSDE